MNNDSGLHSCYSILFLFIVTISFSPIETIYYPFSQPTIRSLFLQKLHDFIGVVCNLPKPKSGRFEVFDSAGVGSNPQDSEKQTFGDLVWQLPPNLLPASYSCSDGHVAAAAAFVDQWLAYQTLWDTQVSDVAAAVGATDIRKWQELLLEAADARATLDSTATVAYFGPITVKYQALRLKRFYGCFCVSHDFSAASLRSSYLRQSSR